MAIYNLQYDFGATPIGGRFLAHTHRDRIARAFIAADLHAGTTQLVRPTMTQSAYLARVNVTYAWWAFRRQAERPAIERGDIPLVPTGITKPNGGMLPASITGHVADSEVISFVRSVGINRVLEAAVAVEAAQ